MRRAFHFLFLLSSLFLLTTVEELPKPTHLKTKRMGRRISQHPRTSQRAGAKPRRMPGMQNNHGQSVRITFRGTRSINSRCGRRQRLIRRRLTRSWVGRKHRNYTVRVFLHDLLWQQYPVGFQQRINTFLTIANKHKIRPVFALFDSCWEPDPKLGSARFSNSRYT